MRTRESVLNLMLRGLSMGARFLLIVYLGKYFSLQDLGYYGIFFTTVTLSLFLIGLDFYSYSNREILYAEPCDRPSIIRDQFIFYIITYTIFFLPLLLIFHHDVLPRSYIVFFYVILVLEHSSQELYRIFVVLSLPIFANWILFIRSGLWIYVVLGWWAMEPETNYSLPILWWGWIFGAGVSVLVGVWKLGRLFKVVKWRPLRIPWYVEGLRISALYFGSTIALKIIEYSSRYMIEYWQGIEDVGIFTFYSQIAGLINVAINTLFIMIIYPKQINAVIQGDITELFRLKDEMMRKVLLFSVTIGIALMILIEPLLYAIGKQKIHAEVVTFYILILSNIVLNLSLVYYYVLYALKNDKALFFTTFISAVANIALNTILIWQFGSLGAAISALLSYGLLALLNARLVRLIK